MGLWLDGYERVGVSAGRTGERPRRADAPSRIILHTTEGLRTFDYPYPPHFTIALVGDPHSLPPGTYWHPAGARTFRKGDRLLWQHCDLALTGYALLHRAGDPETNHMGAHCVQTELISKAAWGDDWGDDLLDFVAEHHARIITALEDLDGTRIRLDPAVPEFQGGVGWGFDAPTRMTWAEWESFDGIAGHQHVPGNDHWDPGEVDRERFIARVAALLGDEIPLPDVPPVPLPWPQTIRRGETNRVVPVIRALLYAHGYGGYPTMTKWRFNWDLDRRVRAFQEDRGLTRDGIVGPKTTDALWTRT